jgi:hypothetical protein
LGVSACVITFNEEVSIQGCFESVAWTDEIIVVDSFSTDKKMEIWRTSTDRVFFRKWSEFRDGIPGLIKAIAYSLYVFMRCANTWEGLRQEHETHKQDRIS